MVYGEPHDSDFRQFSLLDGLIQELFLLPTQITDQVASRKLAWSDYSGKNKSLPKF